MSNLCRIYKFLKSQFVVDTVGVASGPLSYFNIYNIKYSKIFWCFHCKTKEYLIINVNLLAFNYIKSILGNERKTYNSSFQSLKLETSNPCKSNAQVSLL